ncbi:hypothetical protein GCM10028833_07580 [Glycomyces tarimensis]
MRPDIAEPAGSIAASEADVRAARARGVREAALAHPAGRLRVLDAVLQDGELP